jgi:uncharacterized repeat protein (TIGR03847 family)
MPNIEIDLNPVDFITIGTVGPKGQRVFHLQAGKGEQIITLTIEKEQANALGDAIRELVDDLDRRNPSSFDVGSAETMELRDPLEPLFRVAQMGLGYDEEQDKVVLIAQELLPVDPEDTEEIDPDTIQPGVVRLWCTRAQMRALSDQSSSTVQAGRPDPKQNGRLVYYWT